MINNLAEEEEEDVNRSSTGSSKSNSNIDKLHMHSESIALTSEKAFSRIDSVSAPSQGTSGPRKTRKRISNPLIAAISRAILARTAGKPA
jgi:hypothetical protein